MDASPTKIERKAREGGLLSGKQGSCFFLDKSDLLRHKVNALKCHGQSRVMFEE